MKMTIHKEPCLLLEAIELVYTYVNQLPVEQLTGPGEFCIPPEEISRIRTEACRGLDREDEVLQFYFHGVPMGSGNDRDGFLASQIFYSNIVACAHDIDEMARNLSDNWATIQRPYVLNAFTANSIPIQSGSPDVFRPFSKEIAKLPVPPYYQNQLIEVVYNYDMYLNRLVEVLRPVAQRLDGLLVPWVQRAEPLLRQWEAFFLSDDVDRFFNEGFGINGMVCRELDLCLRYFPSTDGYVRSYKRSGRACVIVGLGQSVGLAKQPPEKELTDHESSALRLLANADRMAMIRALMKAPKSCQELIQELELNSGTVFRGLNNMADALLLNREVHDGKIIYRTNPDMLRKLAQRMLQVAGVEEA